jgi:hypothetical protein
VVSRIGLYGVEKILDPTGTRTQTPLSPSPQPVAIPTELSRPLVSLWYKRYIRYEAPKIEYMGDSSPRTQRSVLVSILGPICRISPVNPHNNGEISHGRHPTDPSYTLFTISHLLHSLQTASVV